MPVGLISGNARQGDAIGQQVAEKLAFFRERGAEVRVFVHSLRSLHPDVAPFCTFVTGATPAGEHWEYLQGCDVVAAEYGQYYPLLDLLPLLAGGKPRIIIDYHGVTPPEQWGSHNAESLARGIANRGLLWCADLVVVHSSFTYKELLGDLHLPPERLLCQAYPVTLPDAATSGAAENWRELLGLQNATVLLYVGRLAPNKQVPLLVEAMHHLRDLQPATHLLIVGDDTDIYQLQADECRRRACALGLADRVHLLGPLVGDGLYAAYRCADLLVTASTWESFCIPVAEALALGVPVIAARATALPETVGDAGLTFPPGDAVSLARAVRRALSSRNGSGTSPPLSPVVGGEGRSYRSYRSYRTYMSHRTSPSPLNTGPALDCTPGRKRIAVVNGDTSSSPVSGVAKSLHTLAGALRRGGHHVELFLSGSKSAASAGDDIPIHSFPRDEGNPVLRQRLAAMIEQERGTLPPEQEANFLAQMPHAPALIEALGERITEFDAVIVGPYLSRITHEIARRWPDKVLLLPCFHDEKMARLSVWQTGYEGVAGFLYHSTAEKNFAQTDLGFNHPNAVIVGTVLAPNTGVKRTKAMPTPRSVVYCGRYTAEKNFPLLLEFAGGYAREHPERFRFRFLGEGNLTVPAQPWAEDLGVVSEETRATVLAEAEALLQLSCRESLSLSALEAWQQGTPVIAHAGCAVLADHVRECDGGTLIHDYASFAEALDDLWTQPGPWREKGERGRAYVQRHYECEGALAAALDQALAGIDRPFYEQLQENALRRAALFTRSAWWRRFEAALEQIQNRDRCSSEVRLEVRRRVAERVVGVGTEALLVPTRVCNWGAAPAPAEGPARLVLCARVSEETSGDAAGPTERTPLPRLLCPGEQASAAVAVTVPERPGSYQVHFWAAPAHAAEAAVAQPRFTSAMRLVVSADAPALGGCCSGLLDNLRPDLEEAEQLQQLPDDYLDITQGALAEVKRRIKHKLLNNFKTAYVDVLSRQQSAFNRQVLSVVEELVRCCELLDHAVGRLQRRKRRKKKRSLLPKRPDPT